MGDDGATFLPRDLLESQLAMVDLIRAMYPSPEEKEETDSTTLETIERIRGFCDSPDACTGIGSLPPFLEVMVSLPIEIVEGSQASSQPLQMNVLVPLTTKDIDPLEPPSISYTLRQPVWMSRAEVLELGADMPQDDILAAFDYVCENAPKYFKTRSAEALKHQVQDDGREKGPLLRVWFYFPSLSTREKRKDLVNYAPRYRLTGFVLAGKPGVLCLEGGSRDIDDYMNAIKNESWGDIPSHQKKVSERFREECGADGRKFEDMTEITDDLGEKRGARKNRGDMAALEAFLKEKGVGESFSKVIMGA